MLGKKYSIGDTFEPTGEPLVKLANFDELAKQDTDIQSFLNTFTPDQKYMYLHVIAMSAGEIYGCNVNGDYFPESELIARHKTFESQAKVFKEHDNKAYSKSYGYVPFSWYNNKMHRVELILAIDKIAGKEFVDRVERGERLAVSMGTRVKYDICSICGNHASKPNEYCEHIKFHKKEIYPDGRQAYMINPNPTFFDISIVRKPADKTAYQLAKVASVDNKYLSFNNSLANEFEYLDSYFPVEVDSITYEIPDTDELLGSYFTKNASVNTTELFSETTDLSKLALDKTVPAISVKAINKNVHDLLPAINSLDNEIPIDILNYLSDKFDINDILKSFFSATIPIMPTELAQLISHKHNLSPKSIPYLLEGINNSKDINDNPTGIIRKGILNTLKPFVLNRSSFVPAIKEKLNSIFSGLEKTSAEFYKPNPVMAMLDQDPRMNFGYVMNIPDFQKIPEPYDNNGNFIPQLPDKNNGLNHGIASPILSQEAVLREMITPSLNDYERNSLLALSSIYSGNYNAYHNPNIALHVMRDPDTLSAMALLLSLFHSPIKPKINNKIVNTGNIQKTNNMEHYAKVNGKMIKISAIEKEEPIESMDIIGNNNNLEHNIILEYLLNSYTKNNNTAINTLNTAEKTASDFNYFDGAKKLYTF